jgi:hypothetical protein
MAVLNIKVEGDSFSEPPVVYSFESDNEPTTDCCIDDTKRERETSISSFKTFIENNRFGVAKGQKVTVFSDSYGVGVGASPQSNGYAFVYTANLGNTMLNKSEGGAGVLRGFHNSVTTPNSTNPVVVHLGFNDVIRFADQPRSFTLLYEGYKALIGSILLNKATPASDSSIAKTGSWGSVPVSSVHPTKAQNISGTAMSSIGMGDKLSYVIASGRRLIIGYLTNDSVVTGETWGRFRVDINGVAYAEVDTNNKTITGVGGTAYPHFNCSISVGAIVLPALGGTATIDIVNLGTDKINIDYIGELMRPSEAPPIMVNTIPKIDTAGYSGRPYVASDAILDQADAVVDEALSVFFGYDITRTDVNLHRTKANIYTDNVHDNTINHRMTALAMFEKTKHRSAVLDVTTEYKNLFLKKLTPPAVFTGSINETIIYSEEILASIQSGDVLRCLLNFGAISNANTKQLRCYINETNDLSGTPTFIGLATITTNTGSVSMSRKMKVINAESSQILFTTNATTSMTNEYAVMSATPTMLSLNFSLPKYFIVTAKLSVASDSLTLYDVEGELNR